MKKLTPLIKGLITGMVMIAINLALISSGSPQGSWIVYIFYALYAGGIAWTLIGYYRSENYQPSFGSIFGQGFRCFIIIVLINVIFTGIYASTQDVDKIAEDVRIELKKDKNKTPAEIEEDVKNFKDHFVTSNISLSIFGTLITGAIFTAAGVGMLLMRKDR